MSAASRSADPGASSRALWFSTIAFTICFAVWTIFSIIGVAIQKELGLNEFEFGLPDDTEDDAARNQRLTRVMGGVARQVSLDPNDGMEL